MDDIEKAKRETHENPTIVEVELAGGVYLASRFIKDAVSGKLLTVRPMPENYEIIEDKPRTRLICTFNNGDSPVHIIVINPDERDNKERRYALTSVAMQEAAKGTNKDNAIEIPTDTIATLIIQPGEKLTVQGRGGSSLISNGVIDSVIVVDEKKGPIRDSLIGKWERIGLV